MLSNTENEKYITFVMISHLRRMDRVARNSQLIHELHACHCEKLFNRDGGLVNDVLSTKVWLTVAERKHTNSSSKISRGGSSGMSDFHCSVRSPSVAGSVTSSILSISWLLVTDRVGGGGGGGLGFASSGCREGTWKAGRFSSCTLLLGGNPAILALRLIGFSGDD